MTPAARRCAVAHLREAYEVSERRACKTLGADRSSVRYRTIKPDDTALRERLRGLSAERRRFGYRRLHILLSREGQTVIANGAGLFPVHPDVAPPRHTRQGKSLASSDVREVRMSPGLLVYVDALKRKRVLRRWLDAVTKSARQ